MNFRVDNLQYCNWSREIFEINHQAKLDAVHATICYHEDFDELQKILNNGMYILKKTQISSFKEKTQKILKKLKAKT